MKTSFIEHNTLDDMFYHDVFQGSFILHRYLKQGSLLFDAYDELMQDTYLLLYKMSLRLKTENVLHINFEILNHLINTLRIGKLRARTKGSSAASYIAMKFILDGILEQSRGKINMRDIQDELNDINKTYESLKNMLSEDLLLGDVQLKDLLTDDELFLLQQAFDKDALSEFLSALAQEIFKLTNKALPQDLEKPEDNDNASPSMESLLNQCFSQPQTSQRDPIKELIENVLRLDMDSETENLDSLQEDVIEKQDLIENQIIDDANSDDWQSKLKDAFEERYTPYLKEQFLVQSDKTPDQGQFQSPLSSEEQVDQRILQEGQPHTENALPEDTQVVPLDKSIEEQLRSDPTTSPFNGHDDVIPKKTRTLDKINALLQRENQIKHHIQSIDFGSIIEKSTEAIDAFNQTAETLGMDKNSLNQLSFDEVLAMQQRFRKPKFIQFINKIGRNKLYAQKLQYKKRHEASLPIEKVTSSHHIDWMVDDEFMNLALDIEAFENDFYDRFLQDQLLTFELIAEKDRRKGPIILCYDGSGSMEGVKIEETQAHIISIMEIARIQKRHLVLIQFASKTEPMYIKEINPLSVGAKDILDVLDTFICGGTDFEKPLSKAAEYIAADSRGQSDVLFITDGQCEISNTFKNSFTQLKRIRKFKLYTIIMHSHTYQDYGDIGEISDEILDIRRHDIGNWNEETNQRLYTLI